MVESLKDQDKILNSLEHPSWNRLFHIYDAIKLGIPFKKIKEKTRIDDWFLRQIKDLIDLEKKISGFNIDSIYQRNYLRQNKKVMLIANWVICLNCLESEVFNKRNELGINRVYKLVDTCAAEFRAQTPYFYSTFEEGNESKVTDK